MILKKQTFELSESITKQKKTCPDVQVLKLWLGQLLPQYTITKIKKIFRGRFFKIFLIIYFRIRSLDTLCRLRGNRDDCGAFHFHNLLLVEPLILISLPPRTKN